MDDLRIKEILIYWLQWLFVICGSKFLKDKIEDQNPLWCTQYTNKQWAVLALTKVVSKVVFFKLGYTIYWAHILRIFPNNTRQAKP